MFEHIDWIQLILMIAPLLFAVTVHEVAHGYVAYKMGDPTALLAGRLTLNPLKHLDWVGSFILPLALKLSGSPIVFGYAKPVPVNFANFRNFRRGTLFVSSAGVVANFSCALISSGLLRLLLFSESLWHDIGFYGAFRMLFFVLGYSVVINLVLAIFNLIPIPPLDGSRILSMFLSRRWQIQFARLERYGIVIVFVLLITKTLGKVISFVLNPMLDVLLAG